MKAVPFKILAPCIETLELSEPKVINAPALVLTLKEFSYRGTTATIEPRDYCFESDEPCDVRSRLKLQFKINGKEFEYDAHYDNDTATVYHRINGADSEVSNVGIYFDVNRQVKFVAK